MQQSYGRQYRTEVVRNNPFIPKAPCANYGNYLFLKYRLKVALLDPIEAISKFRFTVSEEYGFIRIDIRNTASPGYRYTVITEHNVSMKNSRLFGLRIHHTIGQVFDGIRDIHLNTMCGLPSSKLMADIHLIAAYHPICPTTLGLRSYGGFANLGANEFWGYPV